MEDNVFDFDEIELDFSSVDSKEASLDTNVDSVGDGLILSLANLGKVDIPYIAKMTEKTNEEVIESLKGSIFQNPSTWNEDELSGWETKEVYLSGNLKKKYLDAIEANELYPNRFDLNIETIKEVTSDDPCITINDIYFTLGSPWISKDIIEKFIENLLGINAGSAWSVEVRHDKTSASWDIITNGNGFKYGSYLYDKYSTSRIDVFKIIKKTLNQSNLVIKDSMGKNKPSIKNEDETFKALEIQKIIIEKFKEFVFNDYNIKTELENCYNEKYCHNHRRYFSGAFLTFPTMSKNIQLYDYQKDAVARIIFSKNVLLAHDVGSGKTYEMIAAGQELIRMNLSKKNLYVVPNGIINQWEEICKEMYPNAKVLIVSNSNFGPSKRLETLKKIKDGEYDTIIMTYSSFGMIELSPDYYKKKMLKEFDNYKNSSNNRYTCTSYVSKKASKEEDLKVDLFLLGERKEEAIYFDDLGIDRLFVDEAHNFKNISLDTNIMALGINAEGSSKCNDMLNKVKYIQSQNDGGGVVFATGTPITNSISDLYAMQQYLQSGDLEILDIANFNAWIANFAELDSCFEISVDTSKFKISRRYSKFHNIPELSAILSNIIDFHRIDEKNDIPIFNGYSDVVSDSNDEFKEFLQDISTRADLIKKHQPRVLKVGTANSEEIKDNMLVITNDGRKAALDLRLVNPRATVDDNYKVRVCAKRVYEIYKKTESFKGTQLIFCDVSTPKNSFNIYNELKINLIMLGIDIEEIEFIHNYESKRERNKLFKKVNKGEVRVLIGTTFKLGTGVNVQERLYAVHHIDVPWRPSDIIQRNGRILRFGNINKEVEIYRYVLKNSFDAYSWQLLEIKQNFIHKLLNNNVLKRDAMDIDDVALNYSEIKALAIGEPLIKHRVELFNEIQTLKNRKFKMVEKREKISLKIKQIEDALPELIEKIENLELDLEYLSTIDLNSLDDEKKREIKDELYDKLLVTYYEDTKIGEYFGFDIIAPAYISANDANKHLFIKRNGIYQITIGKSSLNLVKNIDKHLLKLDDDLAEARNKLISYVDYIQDAKKEISDKENLDEKIESLQIELNELDEKLGINKEG